MKKIIKNIIFYGVFGFFYLSLISVFIHEIGHVFSAVIEGKTILGFNVSFFRGYIIHIENPINPSLFIKMSGFIFNFSIGTILFFFSIIIKNIYLSFIFFADIIISYMGWVIITTPNQDSSRFYGNNIPIVEFLIIGIFICIIIMVLLAQLSEEKIEDYYLKKYWLYYLDEVEYEKK